MNEKNMQRPKNLLGYIIPNNSIIISVIALFAALICIVTMLIVFPIPATQGFINIGDAIVMITALLFGPIVGSLAGGIGSMLADLFLGYTLYAPATLIIKGLEGLIVGLIANPRNKSARLDYRDFLGVIAGGLVMVFGYFLYEIILFGLEIALLEIFLNGLIQFGLGSLIALIFIFAARKNITGNLPSVFEKIYITDISEDQEDISERIDTLIDSYDDRDDSEGLKK